MPRPKTVTNVIVDREFAARVEQACDTNPLVPPHNSGRLAWFQERLEKDHGVKTSRESVRKWLAGESRPRHKKMAALAKVLKADEAWLSLGKAPDLSGEDPKTRARGLEGVVYYVAGLFGLNGVAVAFTEGKSAKNAHFLCITEGRPYSFYVSLGRHATNHRFTLPTDFEEVIVLGVIKRSDLQYDIYHLTSPAISKFGNRKGGFIELTAVDHGGKLLAKTENCPRIETFRGFLAAVDA